MLKREEELHQKKNKKITLVFDCSMDVEILQATRLHDMRQWYVCLIVF